MGIISALTLVRIIEGSVVPKKTKSDLRGNKNIDLVGGAISPS
jgi:hypothetical protein